MGTVLKNSWPLFLGVMLLMLGNGLQGTLLGIRGAIEGFNPNTMAWVMSGYFIGCLQIGGQRSCFNVLALGCTGRVNVY